MFSDHNPARQNPALFLPPRRLERLTDAETAPYALEAFSMTRELIRAKSLPGHEREVLELAEIILSHTFGTPVERLKISDDRWNLFLSFGTPRVVFTTHLDVVEAPEILFVPRISGDILYGRGACDAKGIAAAMIAAAKILRAAGQDDFGLLFVVGEEDDGIGAQVAAQALQGRDIQFLINGEPTEGRLALAHKGAVGFTATFEGQAAHSGTPEAGVDANRKMIEAAALLYDAERRGDFGSNSTIGKALLNLGVLTSNNPHAGIICPSAEMRFAIRTVSSNGEVIATVRHILGELGELRVRYSTPSAELHTVPGFSTAVMGFCTDIPHFEPLKTRNLLYGPGSIHVAHGEKECMSLAEITEGIRGYERLYHELQSEYLVKQT